MSYNFKRSRNDTAVGRTYPNAKTVVIARTDASNKNLLVNPYNNKSDPIDDTGLRPWRKTTDTFGNVFAQSIAEAPKGITNASLLQNPWRFREDAEDTPRTLTLQVIKDINKGKLPKYIREDKGIDQIAYMILEYLSDNGIKMITISLLKSFITGHRLVSLYDKGAQHVSRAFIFFNQLMDTARKYYKQGVLEDRLPDILQDYADGLYEVYGDIIMRPASHGEIKEGLRELGALSGVLSRLFRTENALEPQRLVPYEQLVGLPPNPTPPIPQNLGDNEPNPPQSIKEPDNVADQNDPTTPANPSNPNNGGPIPLVNTRYGDQRSIREPPESGRNIIGKAMLGAATVTATAAGMYGLYKLRRQVAGLGGFAMARGVAGPVGGIIPPFAAPAIMLPAVAAAGPAGPVPVDPANIPLRPADVLPPAPVEVRGEFIPEYGVPQFVPEFIPEYGAAEFIPEPSLARQTAKRRSRKAPTQAGPAVKVDGGNPWGYDIGPIRPMNRDDENLFVSAFDKKRKYNPTTLIEAARLINIQLTPDDARELLDRHRETSESAEENWSPKGDFRNIYATIMNNRVKKGDGKKSTKSVKSKKPKSSKNIDAQILALLKG